MTSPAGARTNKLAEATAKLLAGRLDALNFTDEDIRTVYNAGIQAYHRAHYEQAEALFSFACLIKPMCHDYVFALALTLKMSGKFEQALLMFPLASLSARFGFESLLHAAECLLHLQQRTEAVKVLRALMLDRSPDVNPALKQRAQAWLQLVEQGGTDAHRTE